MLKNLIDSKAIYFFAAGLVLTVIALAIDYSNFQECRAHGWSVLWCLTKW